MISWLGGRPLEKYIQSSKLNSYENTKQWLDVENTIERTNMPREAN